MKVVAEEWPNHRFLLKIHNFNLSVRAREGNWPLSLLPIFLVQGKMIFLFRFTMECV